MFQESGDLFNFIPNRELIKEKLNLKRGLNNDDENMQYSFIKMPSKGSKIIRIELYEIDKLKNTDEPLICKCNAELCVQYVVRNMYSDDVYKTYREIINLIKEKITD